MNGNIDLKALDLNSLKSKSSEAQAAAFSASLEEVADIMLKAGLVDDRVPTCCDASCLRVA